MPAKQTWIVEMDENWDGTCTKCPIGCDEQDLTWSKTCPLANAKRAVEVRFEIDHETGLSVIDKNNKFHFEGQDKYYAVEVEK